MSNEIVVDADELIRLFKELLNELFDDTGEIRQECRECAHYRAMATFAAKLVKVGVLVEDAKMQRLKHWFGV